MHDLMATDKKKTIINVVPYRESELAFEERL